MPYEDGLGLQEERVRQRREGSIPDSMLLLEHPHVITLGSGSHDEHVLADAEARRVAGIELHRSGRGGDVTYHGPGQLVGYPILALGEDRRDLHGYLRALEAVLIRALASIGLEGRRSPGQTGVWIEDRKVGAIGIRVGSGWITSHGFALNVDPDLTYFDTIVPCGIADREVTSIARELGRPIEVDAMIDPVVRAANELLFDPASFS